MLRSLGSASCDNITHETRVYDLLRALGSVSCDNITDETRGTIVTGIGFCMHLVTSFTRQGYDVLRALCSASCDITDETEVRFARGIAFCIL